MAGSDIEMKESDPKPEEEEEEEEKKPTKFQTQLQKLIERSH